MRINLRTKKKKIRSKIFSLKCASAHGNFLYFEEATHFFGIYPNVNLI